MPTRPANPIFPMLCALLLPSGLLTACFHSTGRTAAPVAVETRIGVVRAIGSEQRFVLIETPSALAASAVDEGQLLHCRPPAAATRTATADVRVSRERHESLLVANVVAGEPTVGDLVYAAPPGPASPPTPALDSISAVPTAPLPGLFGPRPP